MGTSSLEHPTSNIQSNANRRKAESRKQKGSRWKLKGGLGKSSNQESRKQVRGKSQVGQTRRGGGINWGVREQPTLETKRLVLRPLMAKDDLSVQELANDPRIARLSIWPMRGYGRKMCRRWIGHRSS
jgi:hypothetical protein